VMATCSLLGQAVGTAAAICVEDACLPADVSAGKVDTLQTRLMEDDCWLPGHVRSCSPLMQAAQLTATSGDVARLLDGHERDADKLAHAWEGSVGASIELKWDAPKEVDCLRLVFDSQLSDDKRMPCRYGLKDQPMRVPKTMVRTFTVEVKTADGDWIEVHRIEDNVRRLWVLPVGQSVSAIRWTGHSTWGADDLRLYSLEASATPMPLTQSPDAGRRWADIVAGMSPDDLAEPDHGLEKDGRGRSRVGA